jgi:hypothetical protein
MCYSHTVGTYLIVCGEHDGCFGWFLASISNLSPTTAVSPLKHPPNTRSELPVSAKNLGDAERKLLPDGDQDISSGPAEQE